MEIIILIIFSLVMLPVLGLLSLVSLSSFAWLYVFALSLLFTVQIKIPKDIRNITIVALSLGVVMMWVALFASCQELPGPYNNLSNPVAMGGFPIMAFEYPPGALGNNNPPVDTWGLFYLNLCFWIAIGSGIAILLRKHLNKKRVYIFFIINIIVSIYGLGYLLLRFD